MLFFCVIIQEKLDMIKQCFSNMKEDGLKADLQSYAACLECLGRQKNPDFSLLERIVEDVKKDVSSLICTQIICDIIFNFIE